MKKKSTKSKKLKSTPAQSVGGLSSSTTLSTEFSENAISADLKPSRKKSSFNLQHWLVQKIRRISYQYPARKEAIKKARVARGQYKCAGCGGVFKHGEFQLDHVQPVIDPHTGFTDWNSFMERMFCDIDGWQILCKDLCHKYKTQRENEIRKQVKKENKPEKEDEI